MFIIFAIFWFRRRKPRHQSQSERFELAPKLDREELKGDDVYYVPAWTELPGHDSRVELSGNHPMAVEVPGTTSFTTPGAHVAHHGVTLKEAHQN